MFNPTRELLLNPTFWLCFVWFAVLAGLFARLNHDSKGVLQARAIVRRVSSNTVLISLFSALVIFRAAFALYMGYVAPLDVMQDIVSAQQLARGASAYPLTEMPTLTVAALRAEPARFSLGSLIPVLKRKEQWETHGFLPLQAHPPHQILLTMALWRAFGLHGAALAVNILSIAALAMTILLLSRGGVVGASASFAVFCGAAALGWEPVLALFRQGQSGLLIGVLVVLAWWLLRAGNSAGAGMLIGAAACLKVYPGLLLLYLLLRHRRAFVSAVMTMLVLTLLPVPWFGWRLYAEYIHTAGRVTALYGGNPLNLSLLGLLRKNGMTVSTPAAALIGLCLALAASLLVLRGRLPEPKRLDREYAMFCGLMLLLSPIVWQHYLVLLFLPLCVLGSYVFDSTGWRSMFLFSVLLVVLSIPADSLIFPFATFKRASLVNVRSVSVLSLALCALVGWVAYIQRTVRNRKPV
jgi:hypothetical protein